MKWRNRYNKTLNKFKVGDKVKYIGDKFSDISFTKGIQTIVHITGCEVHLEPYDSWVNICWFNGMSEDKILPQFKKAN